MFAHLTRADLARIERDAPAQLAARFTTDATDHPRRADPRGERHRRRGDGRRADRLDALSRLAAQPDRGGALSACRRADRAHRQAGPPRLGRDAGADGRDLRAAERELRAGPHRARLSTGSSRDGTRRGRLRRALSGAAAHEPGALAGRSGAGGAWRWRGRAGDRLRRLAGRDRHADRRQFHRLRRRAADRLTPAARAWLAERGLAGGPCRACPRVRGHRRAAAHRRRTRGDVAAGWPRTPGIR